MTLYADLATLLREGRADDDLVALNANGDVRWAEFKARIAAIAHQLPAQAQRQLLTETDPLDFAAHLLAVIAAGHTAVLPANFQAATLSNLAQRLDDVPLPDTPAIELFTSGSSGEPKRIVKPLAVLEAECRVLESQWGATIGKAVIVATVPHHHIYGLLFRLLWPLLAGRPFDALTASEPSTLHQRLTRCPHAVLVSSPAQLARLPELHELATFGPHPQLVFSSGGPLPAAVAEAFLAGWQRAPHEIFGSTETGGIAWRQQIDGDVAWTPLPGVRIDRDDDGALRVTSPFIADDASLRMEDGMEHCTDGRFVLTGRLDRIVKIEEKRLSLPDLEARLASHPWVASCAAAAIPSSNGRRTLIGAVVLATPAGQAALAEDRRQVSAALRAHLADHFDSVLLPRRWRFVEALPYNDRGKLPRDAIVALLNQPQQEEQPA